MSIDSFRRFHLQEWRDMENDAHPAEVINIVIAWIITIVVASRLTCGANRLPLGEDQPTPEGGLTR